MGRSKKKQKPFKKKQGCAAITKARDNVFLKNQRQGNAKSLVDDFECLCNQLDTFGLTIRVVPKDGNCLFRSVADQLFGLASNGPDFDEEPHIVLRKNTVRYLEAHEKQFAPFIEDDTSFHEYCETMLELGTWGGQLELHALSLLYKVNIAVHQVDLNPAILQNFPESTCPCIQVSYHNSDHYNSVRFTNDAQASGPASTVTLKKLKSLLKFNTLFDGSPVVSPRTSSEQSLTCDDGVTVLPSTCSQSVDAPRLLLGERPAPRSSSLFLEFRNRSRSAPPIGAAECGVTAVDNKETEAYIPPFGFKKTEEQPLRRRGRKAKAQALKEKRLRKHQRKQEREQIYSRSAATVSDGATSNGLAQPLNAQYVVPPSPMKALRPRALSWPYQSACDPSRFECLESSIACRLFPCVCT